MNYYCDLHAGYSAVFYFSKLFQPAYMPEVSKVLIKSSMTHVHEKLKSKGDG